MAGAPLTSASGCALINERTGQTLATGVEIAATRKARRRGLLGRDGLAAGAALLLAPCFAVHTAFMRFPIDVVFLDAAGNVLRVVTNMGPWRMASAFRAHVVVELGAGAIPTGELAAGDRLYLSPGVRTDSPSRA